MKINTRDLVCSLLFAFLFFSGCSPSPVSQQEANRHVAIATGQDRIQIPLDDKLEGAKTSLARNFYFVFDGSGSMADDLEGSCQGDKSFATKVEGAKWAVREFMKKVSPDVNLGLFLFDAKGTREVISLGFGNHQKFLQEIESVEAGGGTPLAEGMTIAVERLVEQYKKQLGYGEYRLVVVTDGQASNIPEASLKAIRYSIPIYAIGLCLGEQHPLRQYAFSYRAADSIEDLRRGLEGTLAELPSFDVQEFKPLTND